MKPSDINIEVDISRELAIHEELTGSNKQPTVFDATPPIFMTSLGRGLWPKPNPHDVRLPRAFLENKGLLSSRAQSTNPLDSKKRNLGRGRLLSTYSASRPGNAPSSSGMTASSQDVTQVPADLDEGKAALMKKFLGANIEPAIRHTEDNNRPGQGSLVFSGFSGSGSVKTLPDVKCKEEFPSLLGDKRVPVKATQTASSDAGVFKKPQPFQRPSQASRKDTNRYQVSDVANIDEIESLDDGMKTPASGDSFSFKDLAKEIKHTSSGSPKQPAISNMESQRQGRGRGRDVRRREDMDAERQGDMVAERQGDMNTLTGPNIVQVECLPTDITEEELQELFSIYRWNVLECLLLMDRDTDECIGVAQIRLASERECCMVIDMLHMEETPFPGRYPDDASTNLLVSVLPDSGHH